MALSNIFREPRREITESVVGIALLGGAIWLDYEFAVWLQEYAGRRTFPDGTGYHHVPWGVGMFAGFVVGFGALLALFLTHALGDAVCNSLERRGIHLRPRNRPAGRS